MSFSAALRLTDLDDFIRPALACTLPDAQAAPTQKKTTSATATATADADAMDTSSGAAEQEYSVAFAGQRDKSAGATRGRVEIDEPGTQKIKVNLTDCLACSGCVTSAEEILVQAQSVEELVRGAAEHVARCQADGGAYAVVFSLAPQAVASLAARFSVSLRAAYAAAAEYAKANFHATHVVDLSMAARLEALEAGREFVERYRAAAMADSGVKMPLLCSTCPGWVCYAEKRHAHAVPHMSGTRSPQQLLGALVKRAGALPGIGAADRVYHASLMMCYDKKLEASRGEYMDDLARDVDCVVTTSELVELMAQAGVSFADRARALEASLPAEGSSGSGAAAGEPDAAIGVLAAAVLPPAPVTPSLVETVMRIAARELFGIADTGAIHFVPTRNPDLREATIHPPAGHAGKPLLFAVAHGFRNIQSVLRAVKRGVSKHDYVEVMACPSGCVNGGGQAKIGDGFDGDARALLAAVRAAMDQGKCNPATAECDKVGGSAAEQPTVEASLAACGGGGGDGGGVGAGSGGRSYQADTDVLALYERMLNKHTELLRTTFHAHVPVPQDGSVAPNPLTLQW